MTLHKFSVGAVLALAMVSVTGFGALVFSSRDFQYGLAQTSPSTYGRVDFAQLDLVDAEIEALRAQSEDVRRTLAETEAAIAALERADAEANQTRTEIVGSLAAIELRAGVEGASTDLSSPALMGRIAALAGRSDVSVTDQQTLAQLSIRTGELAEYESARAAEEADRAALAAQQSLVQTQVAQSDSAIQALQARVVPEYAHYDRVRSEARALQTLSVFGLTSSLAQGHPSLLSTLLVLLMGALGALLYLFPAYLSRPQPVTMAEVFVRLIFGMCAALAVYMIANAALSGFSVGAGQAMTTTSAMLNPFTVSLIGVIAGVMSEDIAKWIQDRGRGVLGGSASPSSAAARAETAAAPSGGLVNNQAIS